LDVPDLSEAERLVRLLRPSVRWFKVGSELFTAAGPEAVAMVRAHGGNVFLDMKFHDIPNTVAGAVSSAARLGVAMANVHVAGGESMLRAAAQAARQGDQRRPLLIGVTLLTSEVADSRSIHRVVDAARLAQYCGLDGVVASALEARAVKLVCGEPFVVVAPGIRPDGLDANDQRRTASPAEAIRLGADYLVVGRPVTRAADPVGAAQQVIGEIESVLTDRVV
ncbi:MAG TPA: orotidine-5'-phosphate decarboxylase, partial [bacterium]|nr:orotidine-5'-phosphate decarboxylase [bacterium]